MKAKELFRNFSYTIFSNLISLLISTLAVLIVPKFIGVHEYGYWQLYIFYTLYVGSMHFGWLDGIYLRFGGDTYESLDKRLFFSQFIQLFFLQITIAFLIIVGSFVFKNGSSEEFIIVITAIVMVFVNLQQFCLYILQDTGRMASYSMVNVIGRVIYFGLICLCLLLGIKSFIFYVLADTIGRFFSMVYGLFMCKEIIFKKISSFYLTIEETWINISVGVKLLLANIAGSLIIGIVRYGIKMEWGVNVFGKISLTLNISNLMMTFISAISLVLYPTLRRLDQNKLKGFYTKLKQIMSVVLLAGLFLYYPIGLLLPIWLPKYASSLVYMGLLFPMCVYQGKFSMLISTFMKTFRLEKKLLFVNVFSVLCSFALTFLNVFFIKSLTLTMVSIVVALWIQSTLGDWLLGKTLHVNATSGSLSETLTVIVFIVSNLYFSVPINILIYTLTFILFLYFRKDSVSFILLHLRKATKKLS
ncbi:hypothetical protein ACMEOK_14470 [Lactiplantibacillus plantarum]|uniref:hypothetical protein n=1 Tax=Lactiplantibacillus plantarum TaxID=1590 RepID=UPI0039C3ADF2